MKMYYAKSKQVTTEQSDKEFKYLKKVFKNHKILYYKDGPYNPEILDSADILIITTTDYKFLIGRGIANQLINAVNSGKIIYLLDLSIERELILRLYDSYKIIDPKEWKDGYVRIQPGEVIDFKDGFEKKKSINL